MLFGHPVLRLVVRRGACFAWIAFGGGGSWLLKFCACRGLFDQQHFNFWAQQQTMELLSSTNQWIFVPDFLCFYDLA